MNKTNRTVIIIVVLAIVIGGGLILFMPNKSEAPSDKTANSNTHSDSSADSNVTPAVTITYDGSTFSASAQSLKSGESVKVVNSSDKDLNFDSNPHPVHTDNQELNEGEIGPGENKIFKLTIKGTWGYHNHLNSSQTGKITVE